MSTLSEMNLENASEHYLAAEKRCKRRVVICAGTGCMANGSLKVFQALHDQAQAQGITLTTTVTGNDNSTVVVHGSNNSVSK